MAKKKEKKEIVIELKDLNADIASSIVEYASIRMTGREIEYFLKAVLLARKYKEIDQQFGSFLNSTIDDNEVLERFQSLLRGIATSCVEHLNETIPG